MDPGPCFALFPRYAYKASSNRCEKFYYGGCAGNENNFVTSEMCHETCGGDAPVEGK